MPHLTLRTALRALLLLAALTWLPWALVATVDLEAHSWLIPSAAAFLPYAAAATLLVLLTAIAARARTAAAIALLGLTILTIPRLDRITTDDQPAARGPAITVATSNVYIGHADPERLASLTRTQHIDILAIQENTRRWDPRMRNSTLRQLLPYGITLPGNEGQADGLAVWSRWPLTKAPTIDGDTRTLGAIIHPPGATPIHIRSVHPYPPFSNHNLTCWRRCTRALTHAVLPNTPNTILAGDWNATLDHHPLRHLLNHGYRDTAEQTGNALRPTWTNATWGHLTIDHILVTNRIAIERTAVHHLPGTDHDVVTAQLRLPR